MRFLIDNGLSPRVATLLTANGHDAVHVRDYGLADATDEAVLARAFEELRIIVTSDGDFSSMLALLHLPLPSVIFVREDGPHRAERLTDTLLAHFDKLGGPLNEGSLVVLRKGRFRIRRLPIQPE